jgi:hypothetical protein
LEVGRKPDDLAVIIIVPEPKDAKTGGSAMKAKAQEEGLWMMTIIYVRCIHLT